MLSRDIVTLLKISTVTNDIGDSVESETRTDVFADKLPVNQSEVYQAMGHGVKPANKFRVRYAAYSGEERFEYKGLKYKIIRTYSPDDEWLEITGEALVNGNA
jgi:SPP1 family predicted phage head-tail adaptor